MATRDPAELARMLAESELTGTFVTFDPSRADGRDRVTVVVFDPRQRTFQMASYPNPCFAPGHEGHMGLRLTVPQMLARLDGLKMGEPAKEAIRAFVEEHGLPR